MNPKLKNKGRPPKNLQCFEKIRMVGRAKIIITKKEWKLATPPGAHILRKYLKREYKVNSLADNSGWLIKMV